MIRIVHVSDLHVDSEVLWYEAPRNSGLAGASLESLESLADSAGLDAQKDDLASSVRCIASGDLTANGKEGQFGKVYQYLCETQFFRRKRPPVGLKYGENQLHAIHGNHDIWGGKSPLLAWFNKEKKLKHALDFLQQEYPTSWCVDAQGNTFVDTDGMRVRVYKLDSTLPGLKNVFARGWINPTQLNSLEKLVERDQILDRDTAKASLRIAVFHHPIRLVNDYLYYMLLENYEEVCDKLVELDFGLLLCGHEHISDVRHLRAGLWQCLSGSATQTTKIRDPNEYFVYDINYDSQQRRSVVVVDTYRLVKQRFAKLHAQGRTIYPATTLFEADKTSSWKFEH